MIENNFMNNRVAPIIKKLCKAVDTALDINNDLEST
jgi:hypothetical protein